MTTRKVKLSFCGKALVDNNSELQQQTALWKQSHKRKLSTEDDAAINKKETKQNKTSTRIAVLPARKYLVLYLIMNNALLCPGIF